MWHVANCYPSVETENLPHRILYLVLKCSLNLHQAVITGCSICDGWIVLEKWFCIDGYFSLNTFPALFTPNFMNLVRR
jgi:hypothetical protein